MTMRAQFRAAMIAVGLTVAPLAGAQADWCSGTAPYLCNGCTANGTIKVVVASVRRPNPPPPGETNSSVWCGKNYGTFGGQTRWRVLKAPRLGNVIAHGALVAYKGNRVGHDHMEIELSWEGPSREPLKGTFVFDIEVTAQPF